MKYAFCWQIEKVVEADEKIGEKIEIEKEEDGSIVVVCGPWRDTKEEAQKDEELYRKDKDAFFKLLQNKKVN